ncbi:MAG: hypothetical protein WBH09_11425 [Rugosibacter sp.]
MTTEKPQDSAAPTGAASALSAGLCADTDGLPLGCAIFPAGYFEEYPIAHGAIGTSTEHWWW